MATFILGLVILLVGGALYGRLCERAFGPDDRTTPAIEKADGVDYVPMPKWRNSLINLLNIAGTGPILGPIQGILFGPAAFVTIPIGCVIGGAVHDYFCGMVSMREGGAQMPELVRRCTGKWFHRAYTAFACLVLFLIGVVLMYTPGDIAATQVFGLSGSPSDPATWAIYAVIFGYCLVATVFPIDKIIGRVYPVFGAVLLVSTACMLVMLVAGNYPLVNIWEEWTLGGFDFAAYFSAQNFVPVFFVTVACGILSGFHSTQVTLVTRTVRSEREGRTTFYNMMILEGTVAMVWAAASMAMIGVGAAEGGITMQMTDGGWAYFAQVDGEVQRIAATSVVGVACNKLLGPVGGIVAIIGAIVLSVTSGDTAMRSLRLMVSEALGIKTGSAGKRLAVAAPLFALAACLLVWAKSDADGFGIIWRYSGWANQTLGVCALVTVTIWLASHGKRRVAWMPLVPLAFYAFITCTFLLSARIGFNLPIQVAYAVGAIFAIAACALSLWWGSRRRE